VSDRTKPGGVVQAAGFEADRLRGRTVVVVEPGSAVWAELGMIDVAGVGGALPIGRLSLCDPKSCALDPKRHAEGAGGLALALSTVTAIEGQDRLFREGIANAAALAASDEEGFGRGHGGRRPKLWRASG